MIELIWYIIPLGINYISRIDTPEIPIRYVIEARTDYALGVVFHGLPEEGIKAIDSIFQDYTIDCFR